ncbi:YcaO-like family protein [Streptomyces kaempferi]
MPALPSVHRGSRPTGRRAGHRRGTGLPPETASGRLPAAPSRRLPAACQGSRQPGVRGARRRHLDRRRLAHDRAGRRQCLHARLRRTHRRHLERPGQLLREQPRPGVPGGPGTVRRTHRRHRAPVVTASFEELGDRALDPRLCGLYEPRTYERDPMVQPFDPARPLPWVTGWSLRDARPVLVPARLVYYSAGTREDNFVFECSNGCATGGTWEEAVFFGLLELVERDAFLLGWYGDLALPEIDLASVHGPKVRAMVARAALQGYDVHVFDNRVDLPVPVVTGLAVRRDDGPGTLAFAASASFDPETAVESAVSEILTYIPHLPGQVAERPDELAAMARDFDLVARLPDHAALFGLPAMRRHAANYLAPPRAASLDELFAAGRSADRAPGISATTCCSCVTCSPAPSCDVIAVDQTTPEQRRMGLRTVATLAPGLLPIDFGWLRQRALHLPRLRTAPHRAGLVPAPLREEDLRRVPHPFP